MIDFKAVKTDILREAGKMEPPADYVAQEDILDMMIKSYFNDAAEKRDFTLHALTMASQMVGEGDITKEQVKAVLDKHKL